MTCALKGRFNCLCCGLLHVKNQRGFLVLGETLFSDEKRFKCEHFLMQNVFIITAVKSVRIHLSSQRTGGFRKRDCCC